MGAFEYIFLLTSIVLAAGIERILGSSALGLNVFLFLVLNWWILYRLRTNETWTFFLAIFV